MREDLWGIFFYSARTKIFLEVKKNIDFNNPKSIRVLCAGHWAEWLGSNNLIPSSL